MASLLVTYPAEAGATFDRDYYVQTHLKLVEQHFGPAGLTSARALFPDDPASPFLCVGVLTFRDADARTAAMGVPGAGDVFADIANFTNVQPAAHPMS